MDYPWEDEQWYATHRDRWDALEAQGWSFVRPPNVPFNRVGLTMFRADDRYTWYARARIKGVLDHVSMCA